MTTQNEHGQTHKVATVMTWVLATVSLLLTTLVGYLLLTITEEWSGYVGAESQVALFILGIFALLTVLAWLLTSVALAKSQSRRVAIAVPAAAITLLAVLFIAIVV